MPWCDSKAHYRSRVNNAPSPHCWHHLLKLKVTIMFEFFTMETLIIAAATGLIAFVTVYLLITWKQLR